MYIFPSISVQMRYRYMMPLYKKSKWRLGEPMFSFHLEFEKQMKTEGVPRRKFLRDMFGMPSR